MTELRQSALLFMTIEGSQSVHSVVHDNRMFAEHTFYCMPVQLFYSVPLFSA